MPKKEKDELQPGEVRHEIAGTPYVISDGGTAGRMVFELEGGGKASTSLSIEQPPKDDAQVAEEATGHDPTRAGALPEGVPTGSASLTPAGSLAPTGGGDDESKAKLARQKAIAEDAAKETPTEEKGNLPDGFPSKADLEAVGVTTFFQLRKLIASGTPDVPWYEDVPNVAEGKAAKIEERLAAGASQPVE